MMKAGVQRTLAILMVAAVFLLALLPVAANADLAAPPMPPSLQKAPTGTPSPGAAGGASPGAGGTAKFQQYTVDLRSTDGTLIGNITALDYNNAKLWAERTVPIGGINYTVRMTADLSSVPTSPMLDILAATGKTGMPIGLNAYHDIAAFNITRYSKGGDWALKAGTVHLYLTAPAEALKGTDHNAAFYLLKNDTTCDITYEAVPGNASENATTFDTLLTYEAGSVSNTGIYSLIGKALPQVAGSQSVEVQPAAANATDSGQTGEATSPLLMVGLLVLGLVIGLVAALLFVSMMNKK